MSREQKQQGFNVSRRTFLKGAAGAGLAAGLGVGCGGDPLQGLRTKDGTKVIILGFDGMDPILVWQWMEEGLLPNLKKLKDLGGFNTLGTSMPPQSPVAWSNFITGMDPGGHGIYDFIHRNPKDYGLFFSTSEAEPSEKFWRIGKYQFPRDGGMKLLRKGKAFWEYLAEAEIPATIFCVPSNFPPVEGNFRSLSGMGTPDLLGGYGTFAFYSDNRDALDTMKSEMSGGEVYPVSVNDGVVEDPYGGPLKLLGPPNTYVEPIKGKSPQQSFVPFRLYTDPNSEAAVLEIQDQRLVLGVGEWTDWIGVNFSMVPGLASANGMVRFYLKSVHPDFHLYVSPINVDPRDPALPICTPADYSSDLAAKIGGPFHTQGIPEDTKALSNGVLDNKEFLQQAHVVLQERLALYDLELERFADGLLFFYFSSSDQLSHMFWRTMDPRHPAYHAEKDDGYQNVIRDTYAALDKVLGKALEKVDDKTTIMVMSDHGFSPFYHSFHLSSWLRQEGYVELKDPQNPDLAYLQNINWFGTKAYTAGINGLYLNLAGREANGTVSPADADELLAEIKEKLLQLRDPATGEPIIGNVYKSAEVFHGDELANAPDLVIGYHRGYRGSWQTALGAFPEGPLIVPNKDAWGGDHCMCTEEVPGVLFANRKIAKADAALLDLPVTVLDLFGLSRPAQMKGRNVFTNA